MNRLASSLPEYNVVMSMFGVGSVLGSQLIAEIGDVSRFHNKRAWVAFPVWTHRLSSPVILTLNLDLFPSAALLRFVRLYFK